MNHYEALGIPVGSGAAEVRRAYLAAARRHHPDYHHGDGQAERARHAQQMQAVNEAWAVLGDAAARRRYDLTLRSPAAPPTERARAGRGPEVPAGKGWTPRRGDDAWQEDFGTWADEDERLAPDEPGVRRPRGAVAVLPVALFAVAVASIVIGVVLTARPLVAFGFGALVASAALFVVLPMYAMSRGRRRD